MAGESWCGKASRVGFSLGKLWCGEAWLTKSGPETIRGRFS